MKGMKTGGRKKGTPNKATVEVKQAIEEAFAALGGAGDLAKWARGNRDKFYTLMLTKLLPKDIHAQMSGEGGGPVRFVLEGGPEVLVIEGESDAA